jgi:hypothetical protein
MADEKQRPLGEKEVKAEAKKLEAFAGDFLDKSEAEAFDKWHTELRQVAKHGVTSTRQVFKQIEKDSGTWEFRGPKVSAHEAGNSAEIVIQRSRAARMFGTKPYISSIVDPEEVFSAAKDKNGKRLAEISIQRNLSTNPFEFPASRYSPLELFPRKPSALDLMPQKPNSFESLLVPKK